MLDENGKAIVTVRKAELLDVLRKNMEAHRKIFIDALTGYREKVIEELERRLADARANRRIDHTLHLLAPQDQTKDYERAIRMLEMSVSDEARLNETQFAQYVLDDWHWKGQFTAVASSYSKNNA